MGETEKLPNFAKNILKDMWIGCSNKVATALSEMTNKKVEIIGSSMKIVNLNKIPIMFNPDDIKTTIIYIQMLGTIDGVIVISSSLDNILKMVDILLHKEMGYYKDLSDENVSAVKELGNILAGYYISDLNKLFNIEYKYESPELSVNPYRAIEDFNFGNIYKKEIYVLVFKANFRIAKERIKEDVFLLFKKENIGSILELLSKKIKLTV